MLLSIVMENKNLDHIGAQMTPEELQEFDQWCAEREQEAWQHQDRRIEDMLRDWKPGEDIRFK